MPLTFLRAVVVTTFNPTTSPAQVAENGNDINLDKIYSFANVAYI